ncbi:hypothetical protein [Bdellovibrio bacteriovorus]|uniref:hypothetical protein n=1 Tax=Bdellovibrio bacteriovorus TaxID=959 RepID=UPI0035A637C9
MLLRLILFLLFISCLASANTLPSTLRDGSTRFLARSLGSSCYTMDSVQKGLPCNPAAIAKDRARRFDADIFMGSNLEYIKEAEDLLKGKEDEAAVAKFFSRRENIEGEFSFEASFQAPKWGVSFEPYRIVAISRMENPSLPMIDLLIAEEQSVKGQAGTYLYENLYAGIQVRYTHVRFIGQYFALSEAFAGNSQEILASETQELVYVEPGLLYAWEDLAWQPQISAMLSQWGFSDRKTEEYPIKPEGLLGTSIKPLVPLGLFELGVQFHLHSETENARDAFRVAAAYELGILHAVASVSEYDHSAGFLLTFKNFTSGLTYWSEKVSRGVFIQMGITL